MLHGVTRCRAWGRYLWQLLKQVGLVYLLPPSFLPVPALRVVGHALDGQLVVSRSDRLAAKGADEIGHYAMYLKVQTPGPRFRSFIPRRRPVVANGAGAMKQFPVRPPGQYLPPRTDDRRYHKVQNLDSTTASPHS